jgi:hypothetical protein
MVQCRLGTVPQWKFSVTGFSTNHARGAMVAQKPQKCRKFHRPIRQTVARHRKEVSKENKSIVFVLKKKHNQFIWYGSLNGWIERIQG